MDMATNETPRDLRKKLNRLNESRDLQMEKSREKSTQLKALRGKMDDLYESRDNWRAKCEETEANCTELKKNLKTKDKELSEKHRDIQELHEIINAKNALLIEEKRIKDEVEKKALDQIEELKKKLRNLTN